MQARYRAAGVYRDQIQKLLPTRTVKVSVNAWDGPVASDAPLKFHLHIEDLTEIQLKQVIDIIRNSTR